MKKKWILPLIAVIAVLTAVLVIVLIPKGTEQTAPVAEKDGNDNILLRAQDLSSDRISFIRVGGDSNIELLARLGDDGKVQVALGTCQSCNGSPGAYYTQQGSLLKCNNCGLTFPLNVLDRPGGGCHPIMIDASVIQETQDGVMLDTASLLQYEYLFERVAAH